jgi:hypothetical protein
MRGPYRLDEATIDAHVAKASVGNYALGSVDTETGEFLVEFVGRAESGVNVRLKSLLGNTEAELFMFSYAVSRRVAFEKECKLYHALSPPGNDTHPERPADVAWTCPRCDIYGTPRGFFTWRKNSDLSSPS